MHLLPSTHYLENDDLFNQFFLKEFSMKTDILEKENEYILTMELPGYKKEDILIDIKNGSLIIRAQKERHEEAKYLKKECFSGKCQRVFNFGNELTKEDIKAHLKNGILEITISKKEEDNQNNSNQTIKIED